MAISCAAAPKCHFAKQDAPGFFLQQGIWLAACSNVWSRYSGPDRLHLAHTNPNPLHASAQHPWSWTSPRQPPAGRS